MAFQRDQGRKNLLIREQRMNRSITDLQQMSVTIASFVIKPSSIVNEFFICIIYLDPNIPNKDGHV